MVFFYWAVIERMNQPRNNSLIPNNLGECDIYMSSFPCSSYFFRCMYLLLEPFTNKSWFRMPERTESSEKPITIKRITYIAGVDFSTINASTTITWGRLSYSERRLIYFTTLECIRYADLLFSDAIVLWEHGLVFYCDQIINWAKQYRIPCFSYVDDNFIALSEDCSNFQINDGGVSNYLAKRMNENYSKYYSGVFFSSPHLLSFFTNRGLLEPQKSFLIQPIHEKALYTEFNPIENEVNILYFGGDFRKEIISKVIIPVLKQITTDKNVNFYCPEDVFKFLIDGKYHQKKKRNSFSEKIKSIFCSTAPTISEKLQFSSLSENVILRCYKRRNSIDQVIRQLSNKKIHIQVHPAPPFSNNKYKTINALFNSTSLGAILITSNCEPYSGIENESRVFLLCENTVESWVNSLTEAFDDDKRKAIFFAAKEFCEKNFNAKEPDKSLDDALESIQQSDDLDKNIRMYEYIQGKETSYHRQSKIKLIIIKIINKFPENIRKAIMK